MIHSDMLMWHYDASPEAAAQQILNIMFLVPQISVRIEKLPEEHKKMLKFYMDLWRANRDCLLGGKLTADNPEASYSIAASEYNGEYFAVTYSKNYIRADKIFDKITIINGAWTDITILDNRQSTYTSHLRITDCMGNVTAEFDKEIIGGLNTFEIPCSGTVEIIKTLAE